MREMKSKRLDEKDLKKTSYGTYYDTNSGMEFKKTKKGYKMIVPKYTVDLVNREKARIKRYQKKYGKDVFLSDLEKLTLGLKHLREGVKLYNEGVKKRPTTIANIADDLDKALIDNTYNFARDKASDLKLRAAMDKKIMSTRHRGKANVHNDQLYNELLDRGVEIFDLPREDVEDLLFPKVHEEKTDYDKELILKNNLTLMDILSERKANGEISASEYRSAVNIFNLT